VIKVVIMGSCRLVKYENHQLHRYETLDNSSIENHQLDHQKIKHEASCSQELGELQHELNCNIN